MAVSCSLCSNGLPKSEHRRRLHSGNLLHLLRDVVCRLFPESSNGDLTNEVFTSSSFMCRPCFRKLEKLGKLKKEVSNIERELEQQVKHAAEAWGLNPQAQGVADNQPVLDAPSTPLRSTPKRRTFQRVQQRFLGTGISPDVAILVKDAKRSQAHVIPRSSGLKRLARSVGSKNHQSIARQVLAISKIRDRVLMILKRDIQLELKILSAVKTGSILRGASVQSFSWEAILSELEKHAPTLYTILRGCVQVKRRSRKSKRNKPVKSHHPSDSAILGVLACILLRHKNACMNLFQRLISVILHAGHCSAQTYTRLQKVLLCVSHTASITCLDKLGENYDEKVKQWRKNIEMSMIGSQFDDVVREYSVPDAGSVFDAGSGPGSVSDAGSEPGAGSVLGAGSLSGAGSEPGGSLLEPEGHAHIESEDEQDDTINRSFSPISVITSESSDSSSSESSSSSDSSIDIDAFLGAVPVCSAETLCTYKMVGDNIDKYVCPRQMTSDHQSKSLHYFHTYAVRDRIDLSGYSVETSIPDTSTIQLDNLLPSTEDEACIRDNFAVLVGRILIKNMPFFAKFGKGFGRHIMHEFSEEMSEVVPLGIYLKGEQKYDEMIEVLEHLHQYVPTLSTTNDISVEGVQEPISVTIDEFHPIPLGGDQMTVARTRGCQRVRSNGERGTERLEGVTGVIEDWHAKVVLLGVAWKRLYKTSSGMDGGTLFQLRNLMNRRNITADPSKNVAASEEFFLQVSEGHILSAAMTVFKMNSLDDEPHTINFPPGSSDLDSIQRRTILIMAIKEIVSKFVDLSYCEKEESTSTDDNVQAYACEVLLFGLLLMEFNDAVHESDGLRIIRCWRYFLLLFKSNNRTNYSIEAFTLLSQYAFLLSPRMAMQLVWNRTVNVHGWQGKNISSDLHMEHLNRVAKDFISGLGSNITDRAVQRVGRAIRGLVEVLGQFDAENHVKGLCGRHSRRSYAKDLKTVTKQLHETSRVFNTYSREHRNFPKFKYNTMKLISEDSLKKWPYGWLSNFTSL